MATDRIGKSICIGSEAQLQLATGAVAQGTVIIVSNKQTTIKGHIIGPNQEKSGPETLFGRPHQDVEVLP